MSIDPIVEKEYGGIKDRCQLKCVKFSAFATQETHCYFAKLFFDSKHVADVGNDGHGGCDYQLIKAKREWARLEDLLKSVRPYNVCERPDKSTFSLTYDIDHICCDLMNIWLVDKEIKRVMRKNRVVFMEKGARDRGAFSYFKYTGTGINYRKTVQMIRDKFPGALILNGKSVEELREYF